MVVSIFLWDFLSSQTEVSEFYTFFVLPFRFVIVSGGVPQPKPSPNPKSLKTFSHTPDHT